MIDTNLLDSQLQHVENEETNAANSVRSLDEEFEGIKNSYLEKRKQLTDYIMKCRGAKDMLVGLKEYEVKVAGVDVVPDKGEIPDASKETIIAPI